MNGNKQKCGNTNTRESIADKGLNCIRENAKAASTVVASKRMPEQRVSMTKHHEGVSKRVVARAIYKYMCVALFKVSE